MAYKFNIIEKGLSASDGGIIKFMKEYDYPYTEDDTERERIKAEVIQHFTEQLNKIYRIIHIEFEFHIDVQLEERDIETYEGDKTGDKLLVAKVTFGECMATAYVKFFHPRKAALYYLRKSLNSTSKVFKEEYKVGVVCSIVSIEDEDDAEKEKIYESLFDGYMYDTDIDI